MFGMRGRLVPFGLCPLRLGDDPVGQLAEVFGQVSADDVPQQRPQVPGEFPGKLLAVSPGVGGPEPQGALERDRLPRPGGELGGLLRRGAEGGQTQGQELRRGALVLEQRAKGQQVVAQSVDGAAAITGQLETIERPLEPAALEGPSRDEAAEGAELVLLVGSQQQRPAPGPAAGQLEGPPRAPAGADPAEGVERDPAVAEQTQGAAAARLAPRAPPGPARRGSSASQASDDEDGLALLAGEARPHVRERSG